MAGNVNDFTPGGVFSGDNINFMATASNTSDSSDTYVVKGTYNVSTNSIDFQYNDQIVTAFSVDLSSLVVAGGNTHVESASFNESNYIATLSLNNGTTIELNLNSILTDIDSKESANNYVTNATLTNNVLTLTREELSDLTVDLSSFDNIDNQATGTPMFTLNNKVYTFVGNTLTITDEGAPVPAFQPTETNPTPVNALDANQVVFPAPEANDGFSISDVEVSAVDIKDTDGMTISTDVNDAVVNDDNSVTVDLPGDEPVGSVDLDLTVTDMDGDTQVLKPVAELFIPFFTAVTNTSQTFSTVESFQNISVESNAALSNTETINGVGNGRKAYWIMTNGTHSFSNQGLPLSATVETTGDIGGYSYTLYNLGTFGNPFDSSVPAPDLTITIT